MFFKGVLVLILVFEGVYMLRDVVFWRSFLEFGVSVINVGKDDVVGFFVFVFIV